MMCSPTIQRPPRARRRARLGLQIFPIHMPIPLLAVITLSFLALLVQPAAAWMRSDLPPDNANRTLTRLEIRRLFPLTRDDRSSKTVSQSVDDPSERDYSLLAFTSTGLRRNRIKRAVITLHGQGRDAWTYHDWVTEALYNATRSTSGPDRRDRQKLKRSETLVLAPMFNNQEDSDITDNINDLPFNDTSRASVFDSVPTSVGLEWLSGEWAEGGDTTRPSPAVSGKRVLSSFEAMDSIVADLANKTKYPKMETIIISGHSMGGQIVQRYALIGAVPARSTPVHFVVANPATFAYLTDERPYSVADCPSTYDTWKYGLGIFGLRYLGAFVRESLDSKSDITDIRVRYVRDRVVHYLFGTADHGAGDVRCEAFAQGDSHLQRGRRFTEHVAAVGKSQNVTVAHTTNYIAGVSHDPIGMFTSRHGILRLFLSNINGTERASGTGYADDDRTHYRYGFSSARTLAPSHACTQVVALAAAAILVAHAYTVS